MIPLDEFVAHALPILYRSLPGLALGALLTARREYRKGQVWAVRKALEGVQTPDLAPTPWQSIEACVVGAGVVLVLVILILLGGYSWAYVGYFLWANYTPDNAVIPIAGVLVTVGLSLLGLTLRDFT